MKTQIPSLLWLNAGPVSSLFCLKCSKITQQIPLTNHDQEITRKEEGTNPSSPLVILWTRVHPSLSPSRMLNCSPSVMLSRDKFNYQISYSLVISFCTHVMLIFVCYFITLPQDVLGTLAVIIIWSLSYWEILLDINEFGWTTWTRHWDEVLPVIPLIPLIPVIHNSQSPCHLDLSS